MSIEIVKELQKALVNSSGNVGSGECSENGIKINQNMDAQSVINAEMNLEDQKAPLEVSFCKI